MKRPMRMIPPILAVSALAFAGCGGGDDGGGGGGSETLSKADFQAKANAICKKFNADVDKLGAPQNFEEVGTFTDKAIALSDATLAKLRELKPPKELQDDWNEWLKYGEEVSDTADELKEAAKNEDQDALQKAGEKADERDKKSDPIAERLGLHDCAEG
jgi:hypothetical protein